MWKSCEKAFDAFKKAAKYKLPEADAALGLCYESGLGAEADISKAVKYYKKRQKKEMLSPWPITAAPLPTGKA